MYRTYEKPDTEYAIANWDGDCFSYTVCENEAEYEQESARIKKINEECEKELENYLNQED